MKQLINKLKDELKVLQVRIKCKENDLDNLGVQVDALDLEIDNDKEIIEQLKAGIKVLSDL